MAIVGQPGAVSLSAIQTEFSGSNPISLSEYYKGGAYVSSTDTAPNVPASGQISLSNFWGSAKVNTWTVAVSSQFVMGSCTSAKSCTATTTSVTVSVVNGSGTYTYSWVDENGAGDSAVSTTAATTTFRAVGLLPADWIQGLWHCNVTQAGVTKASPSVATDLQNIF
jgi:hypothetical protein